MFNIPNPSNKSVMVHQFSQVPRAEIPRSSFDRSHGYKTTFDSGLLIPFYVDEALPGDTFNLRTTALARLATPIFPIMDNMHLDTFFFSVPVRLIWDNWQKFNGEQTTPGASTDYVVPQISVSSANTEHSLSDYFGIPTGVTGFSHSALWHRSYNLIWNEWFRDQNLQTPLTVPTGDGPDAQNLYGVQHRGKRHDYFTSCLPWPQKNNSGAVTIPLGTSAPVVGNGSRFWIKDDDNVHYTMQGDGTASLKTNNSPGSGLFPYGDDARWSQSASTSGLITDLSTATAATINTLRQAFQIQKIFERDARGGSRYTELIKSHFGVTSPDARLQRPEFLGGGSSPVIISPIPNTSSSDATAPQGNLAAIGTAGINGHGFTSSFTEHCIIIGMVCCRADLTYQQGLNRMFSRRTRFDYYWPALSHIGEQAVLQKEIFTDGTEAHDNTVFGYQERYAEYRYKPSTVTGLLRTNATGTLDSWHLSQNFPTAPTLGDAFIIEDPPVDRVIAVNTQPHFIFDSYISLKCARPMPVYGIPGLIDHF